MIFDTKSIERVPSVSVAQMIEVDRLMIEEYGISLVQMMENAGRSLAELSRQIFFEGSVSQRRITVLAGPGGNGGGALAAARFLHNWGAHVSVIISIQEILFSDAAKQQLAILKKMGLIMGSRIIADDPIDLIIDGILGYSISGRPRDGALELIEWTLKQSTPILSLDIPSGLDPDRGSAYDPCVRATATMTIALPKTGLMQTSAEMFTGDLYIADISVPPELYHRLGLNKLVYALFERTNILKVTRP
jgi:NAD(P)H-hydrate epimerase